MGGYLAIGLILIFFALSFFTKKVRCLRGMPYIQAALAVFFLISALVDRARLYPDLLFCIVALGLAVKSHRQIKTSKETETT